MVGIQNAAEERARAALGSLSTFGAAIAGLGLGALIAPSLSPVAGVVILVGVIAHLCGMVGLRRNLFAAGYYPPLWQRFAYWLCWGLIVMVLVYVVWLVVR